MPSSAVKRAKKNIRDDNSALIWVLPYLTSEYQNNEDEYLKYYDEIEVCEESNAAHPKSAFQIRIRSMVERSDLYDSYSDFELSFAYNADGIRTIKNYSDGSSTFRHEYILNGSQIITEIVYEDDTEAYMLVYLYDENGSPVGFRYMTPSYHMSRVCLTTSFSKKVLSEILSRFIIKTERNLPHIPTTHGATRRLPPSWAIPLLKASSFAD